MFNLRLLKENNKSRLDSYHVRNSVLIISHITFRDCRVHISSDNLSRNSCILLLIITRYLPINPRSGHSWCKSAPAPLWGQQKTNRVLILELEGSHFDLLTSCDRFSCRVPGTGTNYEKLVNGTRNSVRKFQPGKRAHLFRFFTFMGIFQWDEATKRVPFTVEPEIPEILTKWKAPHVTSSWAFPSNQNVSHILTFFLVKLSKVNLVEQTA